MWSDLLSLVPIPKKPRPVQYRLRKGGPKPRPNRIDAPTTRSLIRGRDRGSTRGK